MNPAQRRLKEAGKESALPYGQALFDVTLEPVVASLNLAFEEFVLEPKKARKFAAVLPLFDHFQDPAHIAAVGLVLLCWISSAESSDIPPSVRASALPLSERYD